MKKLNSDKLNRVLNEWLDRNLSDAKLAGGELLVIQSGRRLCHITKGVKDIRTGEPLQPNAMYRLASMTKPITGLAALIAVQNGWFSLEDDVKDYLPEFGDMDVAALKDGRPVRDHKARSDLKIYQMMCHSNGIFAETELGNLLLEQAPLTVYESIEGMLSYACTQPLAFGPGEYTAYTGYSSFDAIAHIIEMKSGLKYSEFLQKNIFDPLGIRDITFHPTKEQWDRMVTMHDRLASKSLCTVDMSRSSIFEGYSLNYECAGAGLAGAMEDYAKIAQLLCAGGTYNGVTIVSPDLIAEMKKPRVPDDIPGREPNDSWGLGVRVKVHADHLPEGIFGWSGAYGTHFWVDQENEITALLLRNMRWYDTHGAGEMGVEFEKLVMQCADV